MGILVKHNACDTFTKFSSFPQCNDGAKFGLASATNGGCCACGGSFLQMAMDHADKHAETNNLQIVSLLVGVKAKLYAGS